MRARLAVLRPAFGLRSTSSSPFRAKTRKERRETIHFMMDVCRRFPGAEFWTNIFTPYPGSPIFERTTELGIEMPTSLEGWADFFPRYTRLPWLDGAEHERLQVTRDYLRIAFDRIPIRADRRGKITRLAQKIDLLSGAMETGSRYLSGAGGALAQHQTEEVYGDETGRGRETAGAILRQRRRADSLHAARNSD